LRCRGSFIADVARRLGCDRRHAEMSAKATDVAAQLPSALQHFWREQGRADRQVERPNVRRQARRMSY
jgi:hypothetical protein